MNTELKSEKEKGQLVPKNILNKLKKVTLWVTKFSGIIISVILAGALTYYMSSSRYKYDHNLDLELGYWTTKSNIVDEVEKFVDSRAKYHNLSAIMLLNSCDKYDIDIRLALSQGLVESHFGTKGLALRTNSIWNMGAFDGNSVDEILGIYKYAHPNKSIDPYLNSIKHNYLTKGKTEADLLENFVNKNGHRYASYPKYEEELKLVWEELNTTTKLDSLISEYRRFKLELNR